LAVRLRTGVAVDQIVATKVQIPEEADA